MLDLRSCPVCGKLTDAGDKTCPHCGTIFGKKTEAQTLAFRPPEPAPEPLLKQHSPLAQEMPQPVPAQKPPAPAESLRPAAAPVAAKIDRRDPGSRSKGAMFWIVPLIIIFAILVIAMIGVPYLAALGNSWNGGIAPLQGSQEMYTVYNNPALGFTLQYPESWTYMVAAEPGAQDITDITFTSSDKNTGLLVQVADVSGTARPSTLDEWAKGTVTVLGAGRKDFT
ncbi:MAG: zinc ribbon domain-containing protein, partial [Methanoregula sp.]|nr:zinc ribbon domain-containing protein [Methanoregula sp.]